MSKKIVMRTRNVMMHEHKTPDGQALNWVVSWGNPSQEKVFRDRTEADHFYHSLLEDKNG